MIKTGEIQEWSHKLRNRNISSEEKLLLIVLFPPLLGATLLILTDRNPNTQYRCHQYIVVHVWAKFIENGGLVLWCLSLIILETQVLLDRTLIANKPEPAESSRIPLTEPVWQSGLRDYQIRSSKCESTELKIVRVEIACNTG